MKISVFILLSTLIFFIDGCAYKVETKNNDYAWDCKNAKTKQLVLEENTKIPEVCENKALIKTCLKLLKVESIPLIAMGSVVIVGNVIHFVDTSTCSK
ncbi:hypothetical protein P886_1177 [Alteromonadaceae bacterium 2753L.S.0a.02]|nr:hypothetical protein P886_1177 [Alteromonadaceae bacterium 2753L.S.0a.02]